MKSLIQHLHDTSPEPAATPARTFPMTLRDFIDSLECFDNQDRIVEVFLEAPVENAICVKFPPIELSDQEQPCVPGQRYGDKDDSERNRG